MGKNWLDILCQNYNLSFYALSKRTGVAQSTISNIRSKNISYKDVRFGTILSICEGLNITLNEFEVELRKTDVVVI